MTIDNWGQPGCNDFTLAGTDINYTQTFGGTSAAAPQAAAVAALLLSREPNLTASDVQYRLKSTADPWGPGEDFGFGKLNAFRALNPPPPPPGCVPEPPAISC